jgi:hypothetical protein
MKLSTENYTPNTKDHKDFEKFISKININDFFIDNSVTARRYIEDEDSIRLRFYIANYHYVVADLPLDTFKHLITVDIQMYREVKFFGRKYYAVYVNFVSNNESNPKKWVQCVMDNLQQSYQSIEIILNNIVRKYFNYTLPLTNQNIHEIIETTNLIIKSK